MVGAIERLWNSLRGNTVRRILRGVFANLLAQSVIIAAHLLMVPVFSNLWGAERYGIWLLLFTVPSYLALGDFGFGTAAGVRMTMEVAQGDKEAARVTFQSAAVAVFSLAAIIGAVGIVIILQLPIDGWNTHGWTSGHIRLALLLILGYGIICLLSSLPASGFRCSGLYALGTTLTALTLLAEAIVALTIVWLGGGIEHLGAGYLVVRLVATGAQMAVLQRRVPWLSIGLSQVRRSTIGELIEPALAVMALPVAHALFLQGSALVVGLVVGPAAVASFTTVRTLVRTCVQLTALLNHALMPEISSAAIIGGTRAVRRIVIVTVAFSLAIVVPGAVVLVIFGQDIIHLWTRGAIYINPLLLYLMIAAMVINGIWHPLSNLVLSLNRSSSYSYVYVGAAAVMIAACWVLCQGMGEAGAGLALLLLDVFMAIWVGRLVWRLFPFSESATAPL